MIEGTGGMAKWPYNTATWQRLRALQLLSFPLCEGCATKGRAKTANTVDHREPISQGGDPFPPVGSGLASYCARCHSLKTASGPEAGAFARRKPFSSCSPDGLPFDPVHPWSPSKSLRAGGSGPRGLRKIELVEKSRNPIDLDDSLEGLWD